MASFNKVILLGNLTRDPQVRYTPSGTAVAEIGLAVNRYWFDKQTNSRREETTFVDVTLWGREAEVADAGRVEAVVPAVPAIDMSPPTLIVMLPPTPAPTLLSALIREPAAAPAPRTASRSWNARPALSSMNAHGVSPHFGSGCATTAASITAAWPCSTSSTSWEEMFSPPEMITSLERSLILT